jgi:NDP-sugar pyrophosphorylase family protein
LTATTDRPWPGLVLTAGLGTRLRPLTAQRAKPAVPVAGVPLVRRILSWLGGQGLRDVVLNLHHRPETITAEVGDGAGLGLRVRYSWERLVVLGTAGGPRHALPLLESDRFWIVNGDTLTDVDLAPIARQHERSGALVTMALVPNPRPERYGGVQVDGGWVTGFTAPGAGGPPSFHFIGVQLADARVFADLADGVPAESVSGVYRALLAGPARRLGAFVCDASFHDIGTPADYLRTSLALATDGPASLTGARSRIAPDARLTRTIVWDDVTLEAGVTLTDCVVGDRVRLPAGLALERRVVVPAGSVEPEPADEVRGDLLVAPL